MKIKTTSLAALFALTATALVAQGQAPAPGNNDPNRDRGGDRSRNFEEFRQRMSERLKTSLKVSDEEWGVIQPLIERVTTKQRDASGSRFGGGSSRGPGGPGGSPGGSPQPSSGGSDPNRPERAGSAEREALRIALENESTSPETLKAKLAAVRDVRAKSAGELAAAREDLKKVLTVRQEALLVSYGILE
jgi:hypothetical protein